MKKLTVIKSLFVYTQVFFCIPQLVLAFDKPVIEDYGLLPENRSFTVSPDGRHYAFIRRVDENEELIVIDVANNEIIASAGDSKVKGRDAKFISNKYLVLRASSKVVSNSFNGKSGGRRAFSVNIETGKIERLLKRVSGQRRVKVPVPVASPISTSSSIAAPVPTPVGNFVGFNAEENQVYMPAIDGNGRVNLYQVSLETGWGRIHERGGPYTTDWFVDGSGQVLAREDYSKVGREHRVYVRTSASWVKIYSQKTEDPLWFRGVSPDGRKLIYVDGSNSGDKIYGMDLDDGKVSELMLGRESQDDIASLMVDFNRRIAGVKYGGFKDRYEFLDPLKTEVFTRLNTTFPMSNVTYLGATSDSSKIIYKVSGAEGAGLYGVFYTQESNTEILASEYPNVKQIAELKAVNYTARDGLKIPAVITFPTDNSKRENLPLIVMPHRGPEEYDGLTFDWMAQYFARLGYAVLQPNFRGSTGFGHEFTVAGHGKWGREMQDDVTDGVKAMVDMGYVDPERVCIVGAAYGGYSALAGGAFTPELYRCVVSIAGISDLPGILSSTQHKYNRRHWVPSYWRKLIGDPKVEKDKLKAVSPVNFADQFQAPVLLIYGKDDTVVPLRQSTAMKKALKKAKKQVEFVTLKRKYHWLSSSKTRLALLESMSEFIQRHNPPD